MLPDVKNLFHYKFRIPYEYKCNSNEQRSKNTDPIPDSVTNGQWFSRSNFKYSFGDTNLLIHLSDLLKRKIFPSNEHFLDFTL